MDCWLAGWLVGHTNKCRAALQKQNNCVYGGKKKMCSALLCCYTPLQTNSSNNNNSYNNSNVACNTSHVFSALLHASQHIPAQHCKSLSGMPTAKGIEGIKRKENKKNRRKSKKVRTTAANNRKCECTLHTCGTEWVKTILWHVHTHHTRHAVMLAEVHRYIHTSLPYKSAICVHSLLAVVTTTHIKLPATWAACREECSPCVCMKMQFPNSNTNSNSKNFNELTWASVYVFTCDAKRIYGGTGGG